MKSAITAKLITGKRVRALLRTATKQSKPQDEQRQQQPLVDKTPTQRAPSAGTTIQSYDDSGECSVPDGTRKVRFAPLNRIVYHEDTLRNMESTEEWDACWYRTTTLQTFRTEQVQTTQNLFEDNFRLTPQEAALAQEWKAVLVEAYEACRAMAETFASTEDYDAFVMAEALERLYCSASDTLVGLETNMLARIRGKAARQCKGILQTIDEHSQTDDDDEEVCPKRIATMTRPSSHFAHQVAVAHAKALQADKEGTDDNDKECTQ